MSDNWIVQVVGIEEGLIPVKVASTESDFLKTTVAQLKRKIHEARPEIAPEYMRLLFAGKQMEDKIEDAKENTLKDYNIQRSSTIAVVMRVHGGSKIPPPPKSEFKVHHDLLSQSLKLSAKEPDSILGSSNPNDPPRVQMTCGHYVDPNSLTDYCRTLLTEFRQFSCPAIVDGNTKTCGKIWKYSEVRQKALLSDQECKYYETKMSANAISTYCEMKECPGCQSYIEREDLTNLRVFCVICKKKGKENDFCWQCLKEWSGPTKSGTKCGRPNCSHPDLPLLNCDRENEKFSLNGKTVPLRRACPTCGKVIEHNREGCKFIICPRCQEKFCFLCLELQNVCLKSKPESWFQDCAKPVAPKQTSIPVWSRK